MAQYTRGEIAARHALEAFGQPAGRLRHGGGTQAVDLLVALALGFGGGAFGRRRGFEGIGAQAVVLEDLHGAGHAADFVAAVGFGLTTALYSEIAIDAGKVTQSNFHDYRLLRIHEMPAVDVHLVPSNAPPTGVGEPGVPPVAPALGNAIFRLTGKRVRRLPLRAEDLR